MDIIEPETPETHTVYVSGDDTDDSMVIKGINVNGDEYEIDYGYLKNRPFYRKKTQGSVILPQTTVNFSENLPPA